MRYVLVMPLLLILSGCATKTASVETSCSVFGYITWSKKDTDLTIQQVKVHNARREAFCKD
jgi:hypothetical protein